MSTHQRYVLIGLVSSVSGSDITPCIKIDFGNVMYCLP